MTDKITNGPALRCTKVQLKINDKLARPQPITMR